MLIFDCFHSIEKADAFAHEVKTRFNLDTFICLTDKEARQYDVFPFPVAPFIVMVQRPTFNNDQESEIARNIEDIITTEIVTNFNGHFAGT